MLITVGIPFYNSACFLKDAIQSVINQTYTDWRLILIDDGSTDTSLSVASSFIDSRIEIISDGQNRGLVYRLNQLIEICDTKYLARMDSDDIMHPERLKLQLEYMQEHPKIDVLGTFAYSIDINNVIKGVLKKKIKPMSIEDVFQNQCFIHPTVLVKIEWYKGSFYSPNYVRMEDKELWVRKIEDSVFRNLDLPLLFYREVGIPYLSKYLKSARGDRMLIKNVANISKLYRINLLIKSYLKSSIYILFSLFSCQNYLIKWRSCPINAETQNKATEELEIAISN